ncbi:SRPBCC domain-containing protein [Actinotalea sp.]|uniref:SRPBCC family protein n=1 Tax=Actinotalea sp. TaxID=1872145 RepID=UPI003562853E
MPVLSVTPDPASLTLTLVADLAPAPAGAWQLWADPRRLERWWGPAGWPATVTAHELRPGGSVHYVMHGPEDRESAGWWRILAVEHAALLELEDRFVDAHGEPNPGTPAVGMTFHLHPTSTGTRVTMINTFSSTAEMEDLARRGLAEGLTEVLGQMDAALAD